eukprot:3328916-Prymnesium_polylepis.1
MDVVVRVSGAHVQRIKEVVQLVLGEVEAHLLQPGGELVLRDRPVAVLVQVGEQVKDPPMILLEHPQELRREVLDVCRTQGRFLLGGRQDRPLAAHHRRLLILFGDYDTLAIPGWSWRHSASRETSSWGYGYHLYLKS